MFGAQKLVPSYEESYKEWYPKLKKPRRGPSLGLFYLKVLQWSTGRHEGLESEKAFNATIFLCESTLIHKRTPVQNSSNWHSHSLFVQVDAAKLGISCSLDSS